MFSSSKTSTPQSNASDGGWLTMGGIAPLTINKGASVQTLLLIAGIAIIAGLGLFLLFRK